MGLLLQVIVIVAFVASQCDSCKRCDDNWEEFGESCYQFNRNVVNWFQAAEHCRRQDAHLVTVESTEENTFLVNQLQSIDLARYFVISFHRLNSNNYNYNGGSYYDSYGYHAYSLDFCVVWIGYNDLYQEGTWQWVDSDTTENFNYWDGGQPDNGNNNGNNGYQGLEHCAHYGHPNTTMRWADVNCNVFGTFICEK